MRSEITRLFTQDDINKGEIRFSHQQQLGVHDDIDVVVFQVVLKICYLFWLVDIYIKQPFKIILTF